MLFRSEPDIMQAPRLSQLQRRGLRQVHPWPRECLHLQDRQSVVSGKSIALVGRTISNIIAPRLSEFRFVSKEGEMLRGNEAGSKEPAVQKTVSINGTEVQL